MRNRDGRGDRSLIRRDGLHRTAAGSRLVHKKVPEPNGVLVEGLQMLIRQPVAQETLPAARLILLACEPIDAPAFSNGPFVLSSKAALADAVDRYRRGNMGVLQKGAR